MARSRREWLIDSIILVILVVVSCLYFLLNAPSETVHILRTSIDEVIPRLPVFTIPYLAFLPWLWGIIIYVWFKNRSFRQLAYSLIIINLVACFVYLTFQTSVPRDPILENDIFSNILKFIYSNDNIYAALPSLHSALSASIATYFLINKSRLTYFHVFMAILIIVSTLFTKQHFVLDAISGVLLGGLVTWVVFRGFNRRDLSV